MAKITDLPQTAALTGAEHLPIVQGGATKRTTMAAFRDLITPYLQQWYKGDKGDTGAASNSFVTLDAMKALDPVKFPSATLVDRKAAPRIYAYVEGDFTGLADDDYIVALKNTPIATGALVRAEDTISVTKFMPPNGVANARLRLHSYDCTAAFNLAFEVARVTARNVYVPDGSYLVGNLRFGTQSTTVQSPAPCGLIGQSKTGTVLKAKPGLTGTLLQSLSVAGVTFRDFGIDTVGSKAVAWDCAWKAGAGPSTQCVIENLMITVHDDFTDGQVAHVNWDDLNDSYPRGVTVRAGVTPSYTNLYISMVQSGGLSAMNGCIWTGGILRFGCQDGEINHSWGTGIEFASGCLNYVRISAGYMYANPVKKTVFWSQSYAPNTGMKSLLIDATQLNSEASPGILSYFDINLFGSLVIRGSEFIGTAPYLFGDKARGDGIGLSLCRIEAGAHNQLASDGFRDSVNGSRIEVEVEGMRDNVTSRMVTKNRGGAFEPVIRGSTTVGTYKRGTATYGRINRVKNMCHFKIQIDWSDHTAPATDTVVVTGFPLERDAAPIEHVVIEFADPNFAGVRASFSGSEIVFYKADNSLLRLAASGSVIISGYYSVRA